MDADVLTVTLNPTLDVSTSVPTLIDHAKLRCSTERVQVGGGGINVANAIHSLGGHCTAMLPVGGTRGDDIVARLQHAGINMAITSIQQANRECFNVYETSTGHEYRFVLPGPSLSHTEQDACVTTIMESLPTTFLVLSGSLPPGMPDDFYARVIHATRNRAPHVRVIVDTCGPALQHALDAGVFMIKPSRDELKVVMRTDMTGSDELNSCQELVRSGKAKMVALTLGAEGAILVTAEQAWKINLLAVPVTSTVGAGDSFVGGFVWSILRSDDLAQAGRIATACSAQALQTQGALHFDAQQIMCSSQSVTVTAVTLPNSQ